MRSGRESGIFVRRGDRFLVMHRSPPDAYWSIVAGVVEAHESFADAARRELLEETGLDVAPQDLRRRQRYVVPAELAHEYAPGVREVRIENFVIDVPTDWEPVLNEEHDDYRWLAASEAIALVRWAETKEILALLATPASAPRPPARPSRSSSSSSGDPGGSSPPRARRARSARRH